MPLEFSNPDRRKEAGNHAILGLFFVSVRDLARFLFMKEM